MLHLKIKTRLSHPGTRVPRQKFGAVRVIHYDYNFILYLKGVNKYLYDNYNKLCSFLIIY